MRVPSLRKRGGRVVENNTAHALPHLLSALDSAGYKKEHVRYVIITHVHLDHAGASGHLMQHFPNATLLSLISCVRGM